MIEKIMNNASNTLRNNNIETYNLDSQIILSDIMGVTKEFLLLNNNLNISRSIKDKYNLAIKRRTNNEPVAYIVGKKEFWGQNQGEDIRQAVVLDRVLRVVKDLRFQVAAVVQLKVVLRIVIR